MNFCLLDGRWKFIHSIKSLFEERIIKDKIQISFRNLLLLLEIVKLFRINIHILILRILSFTIVKMLLISLA